jgi:pyrroloquinoline quinone biosynthesis protein E
MAAPRPYTLVAELTYRCPLRCPYCSNPIDLQLKKSEMSTEQWCRVFSEAAELGVVQLHLSGGEPTVRKDLPELIRHARKCDLYVNLITGGTLLSEEDLRELQDCGLDHVQLSVQDTDRETAERLAGIRSYDKKLEVARHLKKLGIPLTLNVVVHRYNIGHVPELIALGAELGAQRLELANSQYVSWALENRNTLLPTQEQRDKAAALAREARERYRGVMEVVFVQVDYLTPEPKPCMGGWARTYMLITPTGEVLPCHAAHIIPNLHFDNVQQQALATIWRDSPALNAFRGDAWMEEPCRSCPNKAKDFAGCRCQAFLLTGDAAATDPVCHLSPHHEVVVEAIVAAEQESNTPFVYRDQKNSERLLSRL